MIKNYKKGEALEITYKTLSGKYIETSTGLFLKISDKKMILAHNFKGLSPIDTTKIILDDILKVKKITPKEVNYLKDLL